MKIFRFNYETKIFVSNLNYSSSVIVRNPEPEPKNLIDSSSGSEKMIKISGLEQFRFCPKPWSNVYIVFDFENLQSCVRSESGTNRAIKNRINKN